MKTTKFFLFFFFLIFSFNLTVKGQVDECHSYESPEHARDMINFIRQMKSSRNISLCEDLVWTGGDVFYNVVFEYSKNIVLVQNETPLQTVTKTANDVKDIFDDYGIILNITLLENDCVNCTTYNHPEWGYDYK